MGIKDKLAASREQQRQFREADESRMRRLTKAEELRRMGISVFNPSGTVDSSLTEEDLDARLRAEKQRQEDLYITFGAVGTVTTFRAFGVQVLKDDDVVYTIGTHSPSTKRNTSRPLGRLAGAEATVTDGTPTFSPGKALLMPLATAALARKETADGLIAFPDGTVHTVSLDGSQAVRDARKQCVQFNALAATVTRQTSSPADVADYDLAGRLQKLQDLLQRGLLTNEEYEAKRRSIIESI